MFLLKKIISAFLYPLPVSLIVLLIGTALLWRGGQRWGRRFVTAGVFMLLLFSFRPLPDLVVRSLEQQYEVFAPERYPDVAVRWVVVLSGGISDDPSLPPTDQVSAVSLARLVEGLRVLRFYPQARLLLSGGGYYSTIPEATALREVTTLLGIPPERVVVETQSIDTGDQAVRVRALVGDEALVLVTSAVHLPRSMGLFERQGLHPLPAPAQHLSQRTRRATLSHFVPASDHLSKLTIAWHEVLGLWWARLRGKA